MFKVGCKIVYPAHGIGVIERIEKKDISGSLQVFYIIRIIENGMVIMIPKTKTEKVGLREIICRKDVPKVFAILKNIPSDDDKAQEENWNRRYREYLEKIKTGSVFEIAKVYRQLYLLKNHKELSFGERQVFDNVHQLIVSEIALAKGIAEQKAEKLVQNASN